MILKAEDQAIEVAARKLESEYVEYRKFASLQWPNMSESAIRESYMFTHLARLYAYMHSVETALNANKDKAS